MDQETRERIIHERFTSKMATMYLPPQSVKENQPAKQMYGQELRRAVNTRIASNLDEVTFKSQIDKVWDRCVTSHELRIWFSPSMVAKVAGKINSEWVSQTKAIDKSFEVAFTPKNEEKERPVKSDAAGGGWTIEKCDEHIANMERMIADGEIGGHMGRKLANIPRAARERLIKAGHKPNPSIDYDTGEVT
jgi:hypothetical protein